MLLSIEEKILIKDDYCSPCGEVLQDLIVPLLSLLFYVFVLKKMPVYHSGIHYFIQKERHTDLKQSLQSYKLNILLGMPLNSLDLSNNTRFSIFKKNIERMSEVTLNKITSNQAKVFQEIQLLPTEVRFETLHVRSPVFPRCALMIVVCPDVKTKHPTVHTAPVSSIWRCLLPCLDISLKETNSTDFMLMHT